MQSKKVNPVYKLVRIFNIVSERYNWFPIDADSDIVSTLPTGDYNKLKKLITDEYLDKYRNLPYEFFVVVKFKDNVPVSVPYVKLVGSDLKPADESIIFISGLAFGIDFESDVKNNKNEE